MKAKVAKALILALAASYLAGCGHRSVERCGVVVDAELRQNLLEVVRPHIEFTRPSDGFFFSLEIHMKDWEPVFFDCRKDYAVRFDPKTLPDGSVAIGTVETFFVDKERFEVVRIDVR